MMASRAFRPLRTIWRDVRGVSVIEFGLMLPMLALIGAGGLEFINYVLAYQKIERIASISADNVARNTLAPSERSFVDTFAGVDEIAAPFDLEQDGRVIVTGVIGVPDNGNIVAKIVWQRCTGRLAGIGSRIGSEWKSTPNWADGPAVTLPNNITLLQNQLVVVSEVAYRYRPLISVAQLRGHAPDGIIRQLSVFVSRGQAFPYITPSQGVTPAACT